MSERIRVGTLNLRNTSDRWSERADLLIEQLSILEPDVLGLQELRRPSCQARRIIQGANHDLPAGSPPYRLFTAYKTGLRRVWEGLAVLTELQVVEAQRLGLGGGNRIVQRVRLRTPDDHLLDFYNTHLHHGEGAHELRIQQVRQILDWMAERPDVPQVLVGDFNAQPHEPPIRILLESGQLRSAYSDRHGAEPERTSPTPLNRSQNEPNKVLDYIFVNNLVDVHDAWITFDLPHHEDPHLAASDHYGLAATISLRPR